MIIDKEVEIKISPSNLKYYKDLGYDVKSGLTKVIKVNDLSIGSNVYVNVKCYYCNNIKKSTYKNYLIQTKIVDKYSCSDCGHLKKIDTVRLKYGVDYTIQLDNIKEKRNQTNIIKYGGKSPFSSKEVRDKSKLTIKENYGVDNIFQLDSIIDKIRLLNTNNGRWSSDGSYSTYRRKVITLTNKVKTLLIEKWDGVDYYDNENIIDNFLLSKNDRCYPTIDHKVSVLYGYINNIDVEIISDISNLCITKKYINSKKSSLNEYEFKSN